MKPSRISSNVDITSRGFVNDIYTAYVDIQRSSVLSIFIIAIGVFGFLTVAQIIYAVVLRSGRSRFIRRRSHVD